MSKKSIEVALEVDMAKPPPQAFEWVKIAFYFAWRFPVTLACLCVMGYILNIALTLWFDTAFFY